MSAVKNTSKPSVSPARAAAFDILLRIEEQDSYASELLHASQYKNLSPVDHGLMTELVMGVLRWRSVLDRAICQASSQKIQKLDCEVLTALRMAVYQLRWLERIPAHAAIHESVELVKRARKRSAAPFVNAVLRKVSAQPQQPVTSEAGSPHELASRYAHPEWLVDRWSTAFGIETPGLICRHDQQIPQTTIPVRDPDAERALKAEGIKLSAGLLQKLVRAGNVSIVTADARHLPLSTEFDRVLVDVPCSGTGTLARNPEIKWRLKPEDLQDLQARQIAILTSAMSRVASGGKLIYSTCSLEREENSDVVQQALTRYESFRLLDCREELARLQAEGELVWKDLDSLISGPYLRTIPGIHPCDGFFAAILERKSATD